MKDDYQQRSDEFWRAEKERHAQALERWRKSDREWKQALEKGPVSVHVMTEAERRAEPRMVFFELSRSDDPDWPEKLVDKVCGYVVGELGAARVIELLDHQRKLLASVERLKETPP